MSRIRITANEMTRLRPRKCAPWPTNSGTVSSTSPPAPNLQIQGLAIEHLPKFRRRLEAVGLTAKQTGHDNIRNVFGHPFSGLISDELIDTRPLCHRVTELFIDHRDYSDLPRKMNICMNGTREHSAHFWTQDISFLATPTDEGQVGFHLLLGGTQGQNPHLAWHLPVVVRPDQVVDVTRSILDLFCAKGSREKRNAARFRFLMEELEIEGVLAWFDRDLASPLARHPATPLPARSHDELIGWFPQTDRDLWTMGLSVPLGRLTWQQLEGLGVLAQRWGNGELRTTHEQGIAVVNLPAHSKHAALTDAAALGLGIHADPLDRNTVACTGSQFCNIAVTETKGHMFQLMDKLRKKQVRLEGIRIHMSGCPSSCAQHFTADIGLKGVRVRRLLGTREGFDVFLGGGLADGVQMARAYRSGVDADQLPTLIEEVVSEYYLAHRPGQTFSATGATVPADCATKPATTITARRSGCATIAIIDMPESILPSSAPVVPHCAAISPVSTNPPRESPTDQRPSCGNHLATARPMVSSLPPPKPRFPNVRVWRSRLPVARSHCFASMARFTHSMGSALTKARRWRGELAMGSSPVRGMAGPSKPATDAASTHPITTSRATKCSSKTDASSSNCLSIGRPP